MLAPVQLISQVGSTQPLAPLICTTNGLTLARSAVSGASGANRRRRRAASNPPARQPRRSSTVRTPSASASKGLASAQPSSAGGAVSITLPAAALPKVFQRGVSPSATEGASTARASAAAYRWRHTTCCAAGITKASRLRWASSSAVATRGQSMASAAGVGSRLIPAMYCASAALSCRPARATSASDKSGSSSARPSTSRSMAVRAVRASRAAVPA